MLENVARVPVQVEFLRYILRHYSGAMDHSLPNYGRIHAGKNLRFFRDQAPKKWPCGQLIHQTEYIYWFAHGHR